MGSEILAEQELSLAAVMAVSTQLRIVCGHLVSKLESRDSLSDLDDDSASLVSSDHRHS